jgi:hypothetical protein
LSSGPSRPACRRARRDCSSTSQIASNARSESETTPAYSPVERAPAGQVRFDAADDARSAAEGDDGDALLACPREQVGNRVLVGRARDDIRGRPEVTAESPQEIGVGLAVGVANPGLAVGRTPRCERVGRRDGRVGEPAVCDGRWLADRQRREAEFAFQPVGKRAALAGRGKAVGLAPAPEALACHCP